MISRSTLSHEQAGRAVDAGGFSDDVTAAAEAVVLILTQSWCPQWTAMKRSFDGLGSGPDDLDVALITYEYDRSPIFRKFMAFKESSFRNWEVPYVRMYRAGRFVGDGNAMPASRVIQSLRTG